MPAWATLWSIAIYRQRPLWAEDNLEIHLAVVAHAISWTTVRHLVRVSPALRCFAVAGVAGLARTVAAASITRKNGVHGEADVAVGALHERKIVSRAFEAVVLAVAELEKSLFGPLATSAPFSVTGKAHADALVWSRDGLSLTLSNADRVAHLVHLEGAGDLVDAEVLGGWAVVANFDVEGIGTARGRAALDEVGVDGFGCCHQGEQRAEEQAGGVHFGCNECGSIAIG